MNVQRAMFRHRATLVRPTDLAPDKLEPHEDFLTYCGEIYEIFM